MTQPFKLNRERGIVPNDGEQLAEDLTFAANALLSRTDEFSAPGSRKYNHGRAAILLSLAADALEFGASASIGHNRADRYLARARELRARATAMTAG